MAVVGKRLVRDVVLGRCPRCGGGRLFRRWLTVAPNCTRCHLDYGVFDPGDGPAVFVILIEGALVMGGVLWVEFTFNPPLWVHGVIWLPLTGILTLGMLRFVKALLLILQFHHRSGEATVGLRRHHYGDDD
jgi:uncharacterized protein (DUF983 family)